MSCDDVAAAILDDSLTRAGDFQAHLEQCPRCRELSALHASASELKLPAPPPLASVSHQAVLGEVRRRSFQRKTVAGTIVAGAVAAVALLVAPQKAPTQPDLGTSQVEAVQLAAELPSINVLFEEVESYTQRDLTINDETYAPFGTLALWVRPSEPTPLNERPFRSALSPLHPSPTQESLR